jgi:glycosyltransferase involved in cell wall biosynthesis
VDWSAQCAAVIPCLNEAEKIAGVVASVGPYLQTVVVVDDGSTDETALLAQKSGARVLRHARSCGKGAALKTGLGWAFENHFTWALTLDGDGQHVAEDIPKFFNRADTHLADLIIGNRMVNATRIPWLRRLVNRWMSRQLSFLAGRELPDTQCGFRLINLDVWSALELQTAHFEVESELLLAFCAASHPVEFVPIQVVYRGEASKIRPVLDTWRWLKWWNTAKRSRVSPSVRARQKKQLPTLENQSKS